VGLQLLLPKNLRATLAESGGTDSGDATGHWRYMKRFIFLAVVSLATVALGVPAYAVNDTPGQKILTVTTLDACGYFIGTQTAHKTTTAGSTYSENGTWSGVANNYSDIPVASLGTVTGAYTMKVVTNSDGSISGVESFKSNAGSIDQIFAYSAATGWTVSVTATRSLAFLTSNTNGACYSGPLPRP
jgi:hypothetical protein